MSLDTFVNWSLLKEPMNWIIVFLMLAIGLFGLNLLMGANDSDVMSGSGAAGL